MTATRGWPLERLAEVRIATMTLTRLPVGRVTDPAPGMAAAAWAFPLVGLFVGGISALGYSLAIAAQLPAAFAALVALTASLMISGALHEDGLADTADGLGGGRTRADKLAIMRDSHVGTYGVLALILSIALRGVCIASVSPAVAVCALIGLAAASRVSLVLALAAMPPARPEGLGKTASAVRLPSCLIALAIGSTALVMLTDAWPAIALAMLVGGLLLAWLALRAIGGQTGDILGALQQVTEIAGWAALVSWTAHVA